MRVETREVNLQEDFNFDSHSEIGQSVGFKTLHCSIHSMIR